MTETASQLNVGAILAGLKDFQRQTVDYVFRRLYLDAEATRRFLIADEAGLGKTMVARGVIACAIDYLRRLHGEDHRIDIVYICSNADIARQNVNRLNVTQEADFALASRITLLPKLISDLKERRLNFVSFTPGTSFNLKSNLGTAEERVLLYWLLQQTWQFSGAGPLNIMQGWASADRFRDQVKYFDADQVDRALAQAFADALVHHADLRTEFDRLCAIFNRSDRRLPDEAVIARAKLVGRLRALLACTCLRALEPDLIILDEFQRFKHLLEGEDEASQLAQDLFDYTDSTTKARVLLLSATPYKMYTMSHETAEDDHYSDFLRTLGFLLSDPVETARMAQLLSEYRRELFRLGNGGGERLPMLKDDLQGRLRRVMVRTERLAASKDREGMLTEIRSSYVRLEAPDLGTYLSLERIAEVVEHTSPLEYWKSAPYLLNFMDEYELKRDFEASTQNPETRVMLIRALERDKRLLLSWENIQAYAAVDPGNARLRSLMADTLDTGAWQLLWVPPALPYYQLQGPFAQDSLNHFTKRLIFSSWRVVPKVVTALLSYEAERRMFRLFDAQAGNTPADRDKRQPLLRFARTDERLAGMPILGMLYPCFTLAAACDPLSVLAEIQPLDAPPTQAQVADRVQQRLLRLLQKLPIQAAKSGAEDERWYWVIPLLLDMQSEPERTRQWFDRDNLALIWQGEEDSQTTDDTESRWADHVNEARDLVQNLSELTLGPPPRDLLDVLTRLALGSPSICALRALRRITDDNSIEAQDRAAQIGRAFLTLFNLPEATALLRGLDGQEPYWRRVLDYCVDGGLQAVLDEYAHVLRESLGLFHKPVEQVTREIAETMRGALTLRTSRVGIDEIKVDTASQTIQINPQGMRGRFAQRFGVQEAEEGAEITRADQVRAAFNSPFWPFVVATTSVGQEGLDFHTYCHAIVHWNLPANPVDLEQREGRIHRYKGHAVRKNIANRHGLNALITDSQKNVDPWAALFERAKQDRPPGASDLVPFWIYPGGARIERHVPALPLSADREHIERLRRSLAVYRMIFGQNRQEDLLAFLLSWSPENASKAAKILQIDLSPQPGPTTGGP